ncbi:cytochrome P450 [Maribius pontilimi]|uniref:Cytochrome P450 n=1 Tax=Palleronia pontilimi TaxID=1964209 RepID=A0A934MGA6_9RHOB|nr:cytochrome P450 [Palleronia pontilimi]MBJ3762214.1 cytochrome P450 [Palleronia pontilimi]
MQRLSQSPTDPGFVQDPYPCYARARAAGDIVWWTDYAMAVATTHRAVGALLRDPRLGREEPPETRQPAPDHLRDFYAVEHHSMLEREPPDHTRLRRSVLRAFTSRRVDGMRPEIVSLCDGLIDAFPDGAFDLLDAYARPLPVTIIARLIGLPETLNDQLLAWSSAMVGMYRAGRSRADEDAANDAARDFAALVSDRIAALRRVPGDGLLSQLVHARDADTRLSDAEITATAILLLNAGHEATVHTLGNAVALMLSRGVTPGDPVTDVEELLRLDPPLHLFTRWIYEDCTLFDHPFRRGDRIGLLLASAGRDPAVFDRPDTFLPDRRGPAHLAFGAGPHFCLGAPLARLELQIALPRLFARKPGLRLADTPRFADIYHFHGLARLMVSAPAPGFIFP